MHDKKDGSIENIASLTSEHKLEIHNKVNAIEEKITKEIINPLTTISQSSSNGVQKYLIGNLTKKIDDTSGEIIINTDVDNIQEGNRWCNEEHERYILDGEESSKNDGNIKLNNNNLISNISIDEIMDEVENKYIVQEQNTITAHNPDESKQINNSFQSKHTHLTINKNKNLKN